MNSNILEKKNYDQRPGTAFTNKEVQKLEQQIEKRLNQIEDSLNEKASKSSVAQALHRKVNRQDFDIDL